MFRFCVFLIACGSLVQAVTPSSKKTKPSHNKHTLVRNASFVVAVKPPTPKTTVVKTVSSGGAWRAPNYADSTLGDFIDGDDLTARRAAVDALGKLNGAVVVADAYTGRVLTIVNQKVALRDGFQPCSTIKVPVALAALSETVIDRTTLIRIYGGTTLSLTQALAKSNNQYFASLGEKLGFERVSYYARLFGLGEKAGLDIEGEQAGLLPPETPRSGMGMMTSFGDGIALTPLEYAGLMGAIANGGSLYYLQYPRNQEDASTLIPQIKRHLDIADLIPEIKPGMMGAVEYGTARRAVFDPNEPVYGKTGTHPSRLVWLFHGSRQGKDRRGGAAYRRECCQRSHSRRRCGTGLQESGRGELLRAARRPS